MRRPSTLLLAATVAASTFASAPAAAQTAEDPRPRQAKAACAAGEIQKGIRLLADLYADTEDLNWVYNQARCYQQNGWADEAIERFQEYLRRAKDITPAERAEVEKFLAELEQRRQRREDSSALTPPPVAPGPAPTVQTTLPPVPDPMDRRLTIAAIGLGGAGVLGLVGGMIFGARVRDLEKEVEAWNGLGEGAVPYADYRDKEASAHRNNVAQWVSYSVGALALAGSGACLYLKLRRRQDEPAVALVPIVMPAGGGGQLRLRF